MSRRLPKELCSKDYFLDYRGLDIGVREKGEFSNYYIYDGRGTLISGDSAAGFQEALDAAKNWIRLFHADEDE